MFEQEEKDYANSLEKLKQVLYEEKLSDYFEIEILEGKTLDSKKYDPNIRPKDDVVIVTFNLSAKYEPESGYDNKYLGCYSALIKVPYNTVE